MDFQKFCTLAISTLLASVAATDAVADDDELITITQPLAGPDDDAHYWNTNTIPVCFDQATSTKVTSIPFHRMRMQEDLNDTWSKVTPLQFTGWGTCASNWTGIRILFAEQTNGNSDSLGPAHDNRVNLTVGVNYSRYITVHEFGHAIGFTHGSKRPDAKSWCVTDRGGTHAHHVARTQTTWDPNSIMNYCSSTSDLSFHDVVGAQQVYGKPRGWALGMNEAGDEFGSVLATGDLNGDGHPDLVIGTPAEAIGTARSSGAAFVYMGNQSGALLPERSVPQNAFGSNEANDRFGAQVVMADFDGDGNDEVAISAPGEDLSNFSNRDSGLIAVYKWQNDALRHWQTILGTSNTQLGRVMAGGDTDGDGRAELYSYDVVSDGTAIQLLDFRFARSGAVTKRVVARYELDQHVQRQSGQWLFSDMIVADVQGSGLPELLVAHATASADITRVPAQSGFVDVYQNTGGRLTRVNRLAESRARQNARFGHALAAGDFDGDGRPEVAISALTPTGAGEVRLYEKSGNGFTVRGALHTQGSLRLGAAEADDLWGWALSAGDFNGDGFDDLAMSAPGEAVGRDSEKNGWVGVSLGSASGLSRGYPLAQTPVGYDEEGDRHGAALVTADLDGDGRVELISGMPGEAPGAEPKAGMVLVYRMPRPALDAWYALTQESGAIAKN